MHVLHGEQGGGIPRLSWDDCGALGYHQDIGTQLINSRKSEHECLQVAMEMRPPAVEHWMDEGERVGRSILSWRSQGKGSGLGRRC